ncbi:MAG TPA: carbohydrate porin [Terriglobales bacterium]|nr:carbohydrate porin [Terriglobales bacterium]
MKLKLKFIFNNQLDHASAAIARLSLCLLPLFLASAVLCAQQTPAPSQTLSAPAQNSANAQDSSSTQPDQADDPTANVAPQTMFPELTSTHFWLSGQANFIFQTHPPFYARYSGTHSLDPNYEKATSRVLTLYTGVRLNNSFEILADVEEAGGAALSTGFGLAGFTNLDIVRNPLLSKAPYLARGMVHKVFALSKDKIENERNPLSLFPELPRRRLEFRFGKFSMPDFFDQNTAGSDTHLQFTNWTIDNNGAWDYAADTRGYTVGGVVDYEDTNWSVRFSEALMPKVANGIDLVWKFWQAHAENVEVDWQHGILPRKAGVVRLLGFVNHANMGIYKDAIAQFNEGLTPTPDITNHPWHITEKYGFGVNIEQTIMPDVIAFARWGWNNGKTESFAYTEDDETVETGVGFYGRRWHRKQDRAGVAFVTNGICKYHQQYLADGGLGFLLGDGGLNYGRETIVETYYTAHVWRGIYVAPGVQHINNPGYNRDRGPVTVPSFRIHVEF